MRYSKLSLLIPCALLLSACTTVTPAYKDNGPRAGACVDGGPDSVAQQFLTIVSSTAVMISPPCALI